MPKYYYNGPVLGINRIVSDKWSGETYAVSKKKAVNNLCHQFKKENGFLPCVKISLINDLKVG